jgi:hypothetical protein
VKTIWPFGASEVGEALGVEGAGEGVRVGIIACSVAAKSGVGAGGMKIKRTTPGAKIRASNKKPQKKISPAARYGNRSGLFISQL